MIDTNNIETNGKHSQFNPNETFVAHSDPIVEENVLQIGFGTEEYENRNKLLAATVNKPRKKHL